MKRSRVRLLDRPWMGMRVVFRVTGLPPHDADTLADFFRTRWRLGDRGVRERLDEGWRLRAVRLEEITPDNPGLVVDMRGTPDAELRRRITDGTLVLDPRWMTTAIIGDDATYLAADHSMGDAAYLMRVGEQFLSFLTQRRGEGLQSRQAGVARLAAIVARTVLRRPATLMLVPKRAARRRRSGAAASDYVREMRSAYASVHVPTAAWAEVTTRRKSLPRTVSQPALIVVGMTRQALFRGLDPQDLELSVMADLRRYGMNLELFDSNLITPLMSDLDARDPEAAADLTAEVHAALASGLPAIATLAAAVTWAWRTPQPHAAAHPRVGTSYLTMDSLVDRSEHGAMVEIMFPSKPRSIDVIIHPVVDGTMINVSWDATLLPEESMIAMLEDLREDPAGFLTSAGRVSSCGD